MSEEVQLFLDAEGDFLTGQALAEAIQAHGVPAFNEARASRTNWRPELQDADLSVPEAPARRVGLEGKMLRDPNEWKPPSAARWNGQARYANFNKADLSSANLSGLDLSSADFRGACLKDATLVGAQLRRADFTEAILDGADLSRTDLFEAELTQVSVRKANLCGANLNGASVTAEVLSRAILDETTIMPDGEPFDAGSTWTPRILQAREIPTNDLAKAGLIPPPAPPAEAAAPTPAPAPAAEAPSFLARLWAKVKSWLGQ